MARTISGYAVRFNEETVIAGSFREVIKPGAFTRTLKEQPDVLMLLNHDMGRVLGRTSAGTLSLLQDRIGLHFTLEVDESTPDGLTATGTIGRGDVSAMSFGFWVASEVWRDGGDRLPLRELLDVSLIELSAVALPAYPGTSASLRADGDQSKLAALAAARRRAEAAQRLRGIL